MPLPLGAISLAIDVNKDTSKLMILCLNQDMIHTAIILWTINVTNPMGAISLAIDVYTNTSN